MSCWDKLAWLYKLAEKNDLSIGVVDLDNPVLEDYILNEALGRYYERKEKER